MIMSTDHEGFSPLQRAFAKSIEVAVEPDQAAIALAMQRRMQPVADAVEDTVLSHFATKQANTELTVSDTYACQMIITEGTALAQKPEDVLAAPKTYVKQAARFMHTVISEMPGTTADIFAGYTPIETEGRWSDHFYDASLTDKWEGMIVAALQMEKEGLPRPATLDDLAQGAYMRGLYRF